MRKFITIVICCSLVALMSACSEEVQQQPLPPKNVDTLKSKAPVPENKAADEWPYIKSEAGDEMAVSENLTAKNYVLLFDGSGSMGEVECGDGRQKISVAKEAVTEWAKRLPKDANLGLVAFYYNKWAALPLKPGSRDGFMAEIQKVVAGGRTPLTEGILRAYKSITSEGKKQLGYGDYTIVVVTDGIANNSNALSIAIKKILDQSPVNIYTIGFCIGQQHSLNQPGKTVYKSADNPEELKRGLSEVMAESETFDESDFN